MINRLLDLFCVSEVDGTPRPLLELIDVVLVTVVLVTLPEKALHWVIAIAGGMPFGPAMPHGAFETMP